MPSDHISFTDVEYSNSTARARATFDALGWRPASSPIRFRWAAGSPGEERPPRPTRRCPGPSNLSSDSGWSPFEP